MVLFRSPTPRLAQKGSGGPPGVDFRCMLARRMRENRPKLGQSADTLLDSKPKKNGGRSALTKMDIVPKASLANTMGGTNLVHKRLGGTVAGTAVGIG